MFECNNCKAQTVSRQPANKIVLEKRLRTYDKEIRRGYDRGLFEQVEGWEIVKEANVCPECFILLTGKEPRLVTPRAPTPKTQNKSDFYRRDRKPWEKGLKTRDNKNQENNDRPQRPQSRKPSVEVVNPLKVVRH